MGWWDRRVTTGNWQLATRNVILDFQSISKAFYDPYIGPPLHCVRERPGRSLVAGLHLRGGRRPPLAGAWAVAPPHTCLIKRRREGCVCGSIITCGVFVSGRNEVRTFGALCGLEMFSMLLQIAFKHFFGTNQSPEFS